MQALQDVLWIVDQWSRLGQQRQALYRLRFLEDTRVVCARRVLAEGLSHCMEVAGC